MNLELLAQQALDECCDESLSPRPGKKFFSPFWNRESVQFMYAPVLGFQYLPGLNKYRFEVSDESGKTHTFESDTAQISLSPIWREIPEGLVTVKVTIIRPDGNENLWDARTFFKLKSFPANLPPKAKSYKDAAIDAMNYVLDLPKVQYWRTNGVPYPGYFLYVYPSKMISAIIEAAVVMAPLMPERKDEMMDIAVKAADYLISITPSGNHPMAGVPRTYSTKFCDDPEKWGLDLPGWAHQKEWEKTNMMIYPLHSGLAFLHLAKATGEKRFEDAALAIADYFEKTVLPNGSWHLVRWVETGEAKGDNCISPMERAVPFFDELYKYTGDEKWKVISDNAVKYTIESRLKPFNWEAQFEDSPVSVSYENATHYEATAYVRYICEHKFDDEDAMASAGEVMRFVEDQFVVWGRHNPIKKGGDDVTKFSSPAGLEQYQWYLPIDCSTSDICRTFTAMYEAGQGEIYLAKAKALADSITRQQNENGWIPTHWIGREIENNSWLNCILESVRRLAAMVKYDN